MPKSDSHYEEPGERQRDEAKAAASRALNESARATTAETMSKIDKVAATETARPGDKSPR